MIERLGRKKFRLFAMDIETHNDEESLRNRETSMWLGSFIDDASGPEEAASYFYTMGEFVDRLRDESRIKRTKDKKRTIGNIAVYIYNLSFEWSFLLPVLLEDGWVWKPCIEKDEEKIFRTVSTKSVSSVWEVELAFGKGHGTVFLRDLAKMYGGGLGELAKSFGISTMKGEIDYRKNRLSPDYVPTHEEKIYCYKDTRIIIEVLQQMQGIGDSSFFSSISMASMAMKHLMKRGWPRSYHPYQRFREKYPALGKEETEFLRKGVAGGITYATEGWQYKTVQADIGHIDLHQAHPSSAFLNKYPYGKGEYFEGEPPIGKISCCRILISYDAVRLHSVIKLIGIPFIEDFELTVWDFEIPLLKKCYINAKIKYLDGYAYEYAPLPWRKFYEDNYLARAKAKKEGKKALVVYYKGLNNSSYGKLLERPHDVDYENVIRNDGVIDSMVHRKDDAPLNARYTYLPVGSAIPAHTRVTLVSAALVLGWKNILYFDTDSIFFVRNQESEEGLKMLDFEDHLGGWGWEEEHITIAQFTAPKRYKTEDDSGKVIIKAGGINFEEFVQRHHAEEVAAFMAAGMTAKEASQAVPLSFEEVNIVSSEWNVQRAFRCKGGTLIDFQKKEMRVPEKYIDIYRKNVE